MQSIYQIFPLHLLWWNIDGSKKNPLALLLLHSIFQNALSRVSWNIYIILPFPQDFCIRIFETRRYWRANIAGNQYLGAFFPIWLKIDRLTRLRDFQSMLALSLLRQQAFDQIALLVSWFQIPVKFVESSARKRKGKGEEREVNSWNYDRWRF